MENHDVQHAAVTVALALAAGMLCQVVARHLRLPGIVLLLAAGVLLGPDVAGLVRPDELGPVLHVLVGFAVAVILFEGGLNLDLKRLRREAKVLRRLLTVGALITAVAATLATRMIMGWDWRLSALFGSLVIVTGPTVITPLLRRIKLTRRVETLLEAEGVLIDAIGAVLAVVMLQVAVGPSRERIAWGAQEIFERLGVGLLLGAAGGLLLAWILRSRRAVPEGLENVFTLSLVLALFQTSNLLMPESGIMAVTIAGVVVGNARTHIHRDLKEFKEQLTLLFIGMLFVLLAADVRFEQVRALGTAGLLTVLVLMVVVRPLSVAVSSLGSELRWQERAFLAWLAPRGVVAAAIGSLFAQTLADHGVPGGLELRALVFLVIATTVVVQGLTGGPVAQLLGVRRSTQRGYAIVGANPLARALGSLLREADEEVVLIDRNPSACLAAEEENFRVVYGNALEERTLQRAEVEDRRAVLALTTSDEINHLVGLDVRKVFKVPFVHVALNRAKGHVRPSLVHEEGATVLFGEPADLELWSVRFRRGLAGIERFRLDGPWPPEAAKDDRGFPPGLMLALTVERGRMNPLHDGRPLKQGDIVCFAIFEERREEAERWLADRSWSALEPVISASDSAAQVSAG